MATESLFFHQMIAGCRDEKFAGQICQQIREETQGFQTLCDDSCSTGISCFCRC